MRLSQLLAPLPAQTANRVPTWMLGCFRRRCISFANGLSDQLTQVYWLQCDGFTLDLRLPPGPEPLPAKDWQHYSVDELLLLARREGWQADSCWDGQQLAWQGGVSLQLHNPWPEPALLQRVGNCMMEFAPSGAYVEDWRLQPAGGGPLLGLRLLEERTVDGELRHQGGGLIVAGGFAALVRGRGQAVTTAGRLSALATAACGQAQTLASLFGSDTALAKGDWQQGYAVMLATHPGRAGQPLLDWQGFAWQDQAQGLLRQQCTEADGPVLRLWQLDTWLPAWQPQQATAQAASASDWFSQESATLSPNLQVLA